MLAIPVIPVYHNAISQVMFKPIQNTRISQEVANQILDVISRRELQPGDRLPGERRLVSELGVSRTSVREALRALEAIGAIEVKAGVGAFVKDPIPEIVDGVLAAPILMDRDTLFELYGLRAIIEVGAVALAAAEASDDDLLEIRRHVEEMERAFERNDLDGMVEADIALHNAILAATGNDILVQLMENIADLLIDMRRVSLSIKSGVTGTIAGHRAILHALESRDSGAAKQAMENHLTTVRSKFDGFEVTKTGEIIYNGQEQLLFYDSHDS